MRSMTPSFKGAAIICRVALQRVKNVVFRLFLYVYPRFLEERVKPSLSESRGVGHVMGT